MQEHIPSNNIYREQMLLSSKYRDLHEYVILQSNDIIIIHMRNILYRSQVNTYVGTSKHMFYNLSKYICVWWLSHSQKLDEIFNVISWRMFL